VTVECPHFSKLEIPTCLAPRGQKFRSFEEFVLSQERGTTPKLFPIYTQCITRSGSSISIGEGCIGCMHCVFGCPSHSGRVSIGVVEKSEHHRRVRIRVADSCGSRTSQSQLRDYWRGIAPFSGSLIELDGVDISRRNLEFPNFDSFIAHDETSRIAVWVATTCSAIFGMEAVISREIPIKVSAKPRDGRIDVGVSAEGLVLAIETKTDFDSAMNENRFDVQLRNYQVELDAVSARLGLAGVQQVLVFGGAETKMLPASHPMCGSLEGGRAEDFYIRISKVEAPLVSAQALLLLGIRSLFDNDLAMKLHSLLRDREVLAILTGGVVKRSRSELCLVEEPTLM